jgi:hypothetical protein
MEIIFQKHKTYVLKELYEHIEEILYYRKENVYKYPLLIEHNDLPYLPIYTRSIFPIDFSMIQEMNDFILISDFKVKIKYQLKQDGNEPLLYINYISHDIIDFRKNISKCNKANNIKFLFF